MKRCWKYRNTIIYWIHRLTIKMNPKYEMFRCYRKVFGRWPNVSNPKTLIEKIYWLQLNSDTTLWSICADKYKVRGYLEEKGLSKYLNEIYAVWQDSEELDFSVLPHEFVLKTNNASGQVVIVRDKNKINVEEIKGQLSWWLNHPFGASGGEIHYLRIKPLIFAEKLIPVPEGEKSLVDYKIWCFGGEPFCILVVYERTRHTVNLALYDLDWVPMFNYLKETKHAIVRTEVEIPKPSCLDEMLNVAKILSSGFPEVRVDLYNVNGCPMFGEMTFSTGFGYFTDEFYRILGDKVVLPLDKQKGV